MTEEFDTVPDADEVFELPPSFHNIFIEEDEDRFVFFGKFEKGTLAMLCLEKEREQEPQLLHQHRRRGPPGDVLRCFP